MSHNLVDLKLKNSEGAIKHYTWMPTDDSVESINDHINYMITAMCLFYGVDRPTISLDISVEKVDNISQSIDSYRESFLDNFASLFEKIIEQEQDAHLICRKFKFSEGVIEDLAGKGYIVARLTNMVYDPDYDPDNSIGFFILPWSGMYNSSQKDKILVMPFFLKQQEELLVNTFAGSASVHSLFHGHQVETEFICPEPEQIVNCVYKIWQDLTAVLLKLQAENDSHIIKSISDIEFYSTAISFIEDSYKPNY